MLARAATTAERRLLARGLRTWQRPRLPNGHVERKGLRPERFDRDQLAIGTKVELEHTRDPATALEIAMAHLYEDGRYYEKLEKMERGPRRSGARLGDPDVPPVDRFTIGHGMIGFCTGLASMPWWLTLTIAVGWEVLENPLKRAVPSVVPVGKPDTFANAAFDVVAWMAGYGLARVLPPGPVPPVFRR